MLRISLLLRILMPSGKADTRDAVGWAQNRVDCTPKGMIQRLSNDPKRPRIFFLGLFRDLFIDHLHVGHFVSTASSSYPTETYFTH